MSELHEVTNSPAVDDEPQPSTPPDETGVILERALVELRAIGRDLLELANVGLDLARAGVRSGAFRMMFAMWLGLAATTATVVAAYFLVDGLTRGIGELLGGNLWAGRAAGGLLVLLLFGVVALIARWRAQRSSLKRLKKKYPAEVAP
jgi:hypothetical protein